MRLTLDHVVQIYDILSLQTPQLAQEHLDYQFQNWEEKQVMQAQDRYEVRKYSINLARLSRSQT